MVGGELGARIPEPLPDPMPDLAAIAGKHNNNYNISAWHCDDLILNQQIVCTRAWHNSKTIYIFNHGCYLEKKY